MAHYVGNNPINYIDPTGHFQENDTCEGGCGGLGVVIGAGAAIDPDAAAEAVGYLGMALLADLAAMNEAISGGGTTGCASMPDTASFSACMKMASETQSWGSGNGSGNGSGDPGDKLKAAKQRADAVIKHVDKNGTAPNGHHSDDFKNRERRLPSVDSNGNPITYKEYDTLPTVTRSDGSELPRGQERVVMGSDGSAYLTTDHYQSFTRIR